MKAVAASALLLDIVAGEPPASLHPTVWMGKWIARGRSHRLSRSNTGSFVEGALLIGAGVTVTVALTSVVQRLLDARASAGVGHALLLKPALSLRMLIGAARQVQDALEDGEVARARALLARHLVSRDTSRLTASEVAGAAIESVAENLSDSIVAPLLAYRVGGLRAAYGYRFLNTADAMLGYRTPELEWFGKAAARGDDAVNFIPARVAAVLICAAARSAGGSSRRAFACATRDASRTASPNAGWPMAAMAGALGVRLDKRGHYALNPHGYAAAPGDIARCCRIAVAASLLAAALVDLT